MVEKLNATCAICGKGYHLCVSCKSIMELNPWKIHTDTSEHYKIYQIVRGYSVGLYTEAEAKSKLQMVDLSDLNDLRDNIKNIINNIMAYKAVEVESKENTNTSYRKNKSSK